MYGNTIFAGLPTTIFTVMSALSVEHDAINLGQGFPDTDGPEDIRAVAGRALALGPNQYPPMAGTAELRQAVSRHDRRFYGITADWRTEVLVTSGATEALAACLFGLIEPGDEVVVLEPVYDSYLPIIRRAGGIPRLVRLDPPDWRLPRAALAAAFSPRTKLLILNSPMNPCGKVFDREELGFIAGLLARYDALAVCDEVYEHLVYDGKAHIPLMTLPGMTGRCLRIGSAGKTFALTGWKVGYITAAAAILEPVANAHQFLTFTTPPALQDAVAFGLAKEDSYYAGLADGMQARRDRLAAGLEGVGFAVLDAPGSYFLTADFRPLGVNGDDGLFCRTITAEAGVAAIPISAFYESEAPRHFARFCFCKQEAVLDEAVLRLERYFRRLTPGKGRDTSGTPRRRA